MTERQIEKLSKDIESYIGEVLSKPQYKGFSFKVTRINTDIMCVYGKLMGLGVNDSYCSDISGYIYRKFENVRHLSINDNISNRAQYRETKFIKKLSETW